MRERKFKKSHIHILQTETLSRECKFTESAQEIVGSIPYCLRTIDLCIPNVKTLILFLLRCILQELGILLGGCLTVKKFEE